ncbi:MAG: four helix bundle protein [Candidatus Sulfotelmatobacter sp.]|jgi:four helix bundle protein
MGHGIAVRLLLKPVVHFYRDLVVWKKSMALVLGVYRCTRCFPKTETDGLTSQLRRAAVAIPSNIAEGQVRLSAVEFERYVGNARGSLMEVETRVLIAQDLGYIEHGESDSLLAMTAEVGQVLNGLLATLPDRR